VKTLPLTEARKDLSKIVDEVSNVHEHITITRQGKPAAVVMSADEFESWQETLEILADPKAMAAIRRAWPRPGRVSSRRPKRAPIM